MTQTVSRNHHFVSQCYLRGFAAQKRKPKLFVLDAIEKKYFYTSPNNVANERDFNRNKISGQRVDAIESIYAEFEGQLAPALKRTINANEFSSEEDRILILNLLTLFAVRNPRFRQMTKDFEERTSKLMLQLLTSSEERWNTNLRRIKEEDKGEDLPTVTYADIKAFVDEDAYTIEFPNEHHVLRELNLFDSLIPVIFERNWMLLKSKSGNFITSDHPVCLQWSNPQRASNFYGPGFGLHGTEVLFPLSAKLALIGSFDALARVTQVNEHAVAAFNGAVISHARRQIYALDSDFAYTFNLNEKPRRGIELKNDRRFLIKAEQFNQS